MMRATLAALVAAAVALAGCQSHIVRDTAEPMGIAIFEEEDLSGAPYVEPLSILIVRHSVGRVCYANDRTRQDPTQYYTDCAIAKLAGAHILPAN